MKTKPFFTFGLTLAALALVPFALQAETVKTTVTVQANVPLNDTKVFVQAGDKVSFSATGQWTVKPKENVMVGPEGEAGTSAPAGYELPGAPIGALLAVVSGKRYLVGAKADITFDNSGQLFLTANTQSKLSAYLGNKGSLTVDLTVLHSAASEISGRYEIAFQENQLVLSSGKEKRVIPLDSFQKEKLSNEWGEAVPVPENLSEHLKALSGTVRIEVKDVHVYVSDAQDPKKPPQKGIYNPDKKEFLLHLEGSFKPVGACFFLYTKNITARLVESKAGAPLQGEVNLTLTLACKGPQGQQGKGKIVNLALPFTGKRVGGL
jgi:hypothetical protein